MALIIDAKFFLIQIQHLLKLNRVWKYKNRRIKFIQIQHLLKLNR